MDKDNFNNFKKELYNDYKKLLIRKLKKYKIPAGSLGGSMFSKGYDMYNALNNELDKMEKHYNL